MLRDTCHKSVSLHDTRTSYKRACGQFIPQLLVCSQAGAHICFGHITTTPTQSFSVMDLKAGLDAIPEQKQHFKCCIQSISQSHKLGAHLCDGGSSSVPFQSPRLWNGHSRIQVPLLTKWKNVNQLSRFQMLVCLLDTEH